MKFCVDETLMHVCRLLRMFNYSCRVIEDLREEHVDCFIITRNKTLYKKALEYNIKAQYFNTTNKYEIIKALVDDKIIKIDLRESRKYCTLCNSPLIKTSTADVPKKVRAYHDLYYYCNKCHKYYWKGKHWEHIKEMLHKHNIKHIS